MTKSSYLPFSEARAITRKLGILNYQEWQIWVKSGKKPDNIPPIPHLYYKNSGWIDYSDFLNFPLLSYHQAQKFASEIGLKNKNEWDHYVKNTTIPTGIPKMPHNVYKRKGWAGWKSFLGKTHGHKATKINLEEARKLLLLLGIKNHDEWDDFLQNEKNFDLRLPRRPNYHYKNSGWRGWEHFFQYAIDANAQYPGYIAAKKFAINYPIRKKEQWYRLFIEKKMPSYLPQNPDAFYKNTGWKDWGTFLSSNEDNILGYQNFKSAKKLALLLNIVNSRAWKKMWNTGQLGNQYPKNPDIYYANTGWAGWVDFLPVKHSEKQGISSIKDQEVIPEYLGYQEAKKLVISLNIESESDWKEWIDILMEQYNLPRNPAMYYKSKGWKNWEDFLSLQA